MKYHYIQVKIITPHKPLYFQGSMLRGALGYALKKVICINPSYKCKGCFAKSTCLYYDFYEKQNSYHNYRLDIELGNKKFDFGIYLFNDANANNLPYLLSAIDMMLTKIGLTKDNYKFKDIEINTTRNIFKLDNYCPDIKIKLLTPIRIKKNNKFLRDNIELEDILRSIYQRYQKLESGEDIYRLDYKPTYKTSIKTISYKPLLRKSNRQKSQMNMDGIIGEMAVIGIDKRSYELLKIGEIIGVGKQTVMGLGKIEVEIISN